MNEDYFKVPQEDYEQAFPIGAIIEDAKAKYKILEFQIQEKTHKYKVEVLEQKIPIPERFKPFMDFKIHWIIVLPQNLPNIKRIA